MTAIAEEIDESQMTDAHENEDVIAPTLGVNRQRDAYKARLEEKERIKEEYYARK